MKSELLERTHLNGLLRWTLTDSAPGSLLEIAGTWPMKSPKSEDREIEWDQDEADEAQEGGCCRADEESSWIADGEREMRAHQSSAASRTEQSRESHAPGSGASDATLIGSYAFDFDSFA